MLIQEFAYDWPDISLSLISLHSNVMHLRSYNSKRSINVFYDYGYDYWRGMTCCMFWLIWPRQYFLG